MKIKKTLYEFLPIIFFLLLASDQAIAKNKVRKPHVSQSVSASPVLDDTFPSLGELYNAQSITDSVPVSQSPTVVTPTATSNELFPSLMTSSASQPVQQNPTVTSQWGNSYQQSIPKQSARQYSYVSSTSNQTFRPIPRAGIVYEGFRIKINEYHIIIGQGFQGGHTKDSISANYNPRSIISSRSFPNGIVEYKIQQENAGGIISKTIYPITWSKDKILNIILDIVKQEIDYFKTSTNGRYILEKTKDNVCLKLVVIKDQQTLNVITAYPVATPYFRTGYNCNTAYPAY